MKNNKLKKLLSSLAIFALIIGLVGTTVVSGNEIEETLVDEADTDDINKQEEKISEEAIKEDDEVQDKAENSVEDITSQEMKFDTNVIDISNDVTTLSGSTLIADTTSLAEAFPDEGFRAYVAEKVLGLSAGSYDGDTKLTTANITKISTFKTMSISADYRVESLSGIKYFSGLMVLVASNNTLKGDLDLTLLGSLSSVNVNGNNLSNLNVSNLSNLVSLQCMNNGLDTLNISGTQLTNLLYAGGNNLTTIDESALGSIKTLHLHNNKLTSFDASYLTSTTTAVRIDGNQITGDLDFTNAVNLSSLYANSNQITGLDLSNSANLSILHVSMNKNLKANTLLINDIAKTKITRFQYYYTGIESLDLNDYTSLSSLLMITKATNAKLDNINGIYISGSKLYGDAIIRITGTAGFISWDKTSKYYELYADGSPKYAVVLPFIEENGDLTMIVSSYFDLVEDSLADNEGNLIVGATLDNVNDDGSITLDSGTILTGDGVYEFTGEFTIKDGEITTGDNYSYSKNIVDEEGNVVIGGETTTITVPEGSEINININDSAKAVTYPAGSTVTNKDGNTIYVIDDIKMDSDGTISSGSYITVPNGTAVVDNGNGTVTIPKDMVVTIDGENTVYPGEIIFDTSTGKTEYLPISGLITEDETNGTNLGDGVDEESLSKAEEMLDLITDGKLKDQLEEIVNTVKDMLGASKEVNNMYDADGNLKETVTEERIKEIEDIVNALPEGTFKDNLKDKVEEAQTILDQRKEDAQNKVDNLFNKDKTDLGDGVGQIEIDEAQKAVDKLPNGNKKDELQKEINKAQDMLDAKDAVKDLFNPDGSIKDDVTQKDIDNAQKEIDKLLDGNLKEQLQKQINDAQKQNDEKTFVVISGFETFTGKGSVSAKIDAPVEKFSKVYVNGVVLDTSKYEVTRGSTVVTLKENYLLTLANGTYDIEVEFNSGAKINIPLKVNITSNPSVVPPHKTPSGNQTSTENTKSVNTGDATDLNGLYVMLTISLLGLVVIIKRRKQTY